ncbi:tyrosine-protein phosphatase [Avibacterium avium]|uniref:tyrosine-protein phosphatase n=1 Tax=Avibacterium avium TaxID=751 RepID=UPI003BF799A8
MKKIYIIIPMLLISSCTTTPTETPQNTQHWAVLQNQETNLYNIDNKLFRSEQLTSENYDLIQKYNIKTIVNLRFFDRNEDRNAFQHTNLKLINTPLLSWAITPKEVANVLWEIEQAQNQGAVLVHCYHGADRTGLISAMYRIIYQNWEPNEAKREMIEGPYGFHSIWKNIEGFFTPDNINQVRENLIQLRMNKN